MFIITRKSECHLTQFQYISYKWVSFAELLQAAGSSFFVRLFDKFGFHTLTKEIFIKLLFIGTLTTHHNDIEFLFYFSCNQMAVAVMILHFSTLFFFCN